MTHQLVAGLEIGDIAEFFDAVQEAADQAGSGFVISIADEPSRLRIIHASQGAATIFGRRADDLRGCCFPDLLAPDERERIRGVIVERNRGGALPTLIRTAIHRSDGTSVPVDVGTNRIKVGGRELAVTFINDISERLRAEQEMRRSEARFRTVVENAPDGVTILRDHRIAYLNPTAARMLGFGSAEAALGADITQLLIPGDDARARDRLDETVRTGKALRPGTEYTVRAPGHPDRTFEVVSVPIEFEGGPAVIGFARDITERKAIQQKLARADRLATIGALAGALAHEVNNPLACVQMAIESIERDLSGLAVPQEELTSIKNALEESQHSIARVQRIVRHLEGTSSIGLETKSPVDIESTIEHAIKICENDIRHRALLIRSYAPAPPVLANQAHLEQVFLNLLVNAAQSFTDSDLAKNQIRIDLAHAPSGLVTIEIADTGCGIAPESMGQIFDPFFSTKPASIGTGLGLAICRQIVQDVAGTIEISSELGRGTRVRVVLPEHQSPARATSPETPSPRRSILLIDDEPVIRALFTKLIEPIHEIVTADSAAAALAILEHRRDFDAILCDLMMPGTNGKQLYETLCRRWPGIDRRIAFITGGVFDQSLTRFLADVANPKLLKPFLLADVLRTVELIARG